jgi:hypothetical protein
LARGKPLSTRGLFEGYIFGLSIFPFSSIPLVFYTCFLLFSLFAGKLRERCIEDGISKAIYRGQYVESDPSRSKHRGRVVSTRSSFEEKAISQLLFVNLHPPLPSSRSFSPSLPSNSLLLYAQFVEGELPRRKSCSTDPCFQHFPPLFTSTPITLLLSLAFRRGRVVSTKPSGSTFRREGHLRDTFLELPPSSSPLPLLPSPLPLLPSPLPLLPSTLTFHTYLLHFSFTLTSLPHLPTNTIKSSTFQALHCSACFSSGTSASRISLSANQGCGQDLVRLFFHDASSTARTEGHLTHS